MKTFVLYVTVVVSCCLAAVAQTAKPAAPKAPAAKTAPRTIMPEARAAMLAKTGGMIQSKAEGPMILFLNTQTRVSDLNFSAFINYFHQFTRLPAELKNESSASPIEAALIALKSTNTAAVVVIGDSESYPSLLIAPESRWAFVNVAALADGNSSNDKIAERTIKETWRAFGFLMGAAHSNYENCVMKSILNLSDLDSLGPKTICPEPFGKITAHAQRLGIKQTRRTTYRKAVEEGWAPPPTNDVQKAIWQEIKKQ